MLYLQMFSTRCDVMLEVCRHFLKCLFSSIIDVLGIVQSNSKS